MLDSIGKNTVISPDFLVWKFFEKAQFPHSFGRGNCAFPQNFQTRKSGETTVFFAGQGSEYTFVMSRNS